MWGRFAQKSNMTIRKTGVGAMIVLASFAACTKKDNNNTTSTAGSSIRIVTGPAGEKQELNANVDDASYLNFNPQTVLADGGSPLHAYTWSIENGSSIPSGIKIAPLTGVITYPGTSGSSFSTGTIPIKVKVSDGSSSATGYVNLKVTNYTPGPGAILQQLSVNFQLVNGVANKSYGASLFAMGGTPPYSWSLDETYAGSADLTAAGLTVDGTAGIVRGTIMNSASGKTVKFKVVVTDHTGATAVGNPVYSIKID